MKSLELTQEHKEKLLEISKILFPEYDDIIFHNESTDFGHWDESFIHLFPNQGALGRISIHWFEFILFHLSHKIEELENYRDYAKSIEQMMYSYYYTNQHPVDYLYELFEKLKSEEYSYEKL